MPRKVNHAVRLKRASINDGLPLGLRPSDPVPNVPHVDSRIVREWLAWLQEHVPGADPLDTLLVADGVTIGDLLDGPADAVPSVTTFDALAERLSALDPHPRRRPLL